MRRFILIVPLLAITITSCTSTKTTAVTPAAPQPQPAVEKAVFDRILDNLLPGMGAKSIVDREKPQQDFQQLCFAVARPGAEAERELLCQCICGRLGPKTTEPARVWLLRQLERMSGAESVPTLAGLLKDENPRIRECSRRALQNNPAPAAAAALRAALDEAIDVTWQVALINALAARNERDEEFLGAARLFIFRGADETAVAAINALGTDGGNESAFFLHTLWKDDPNQVRAIVGGQSDSQIDLRPAVADALLRCVDRLLTEDQAEMAGEISTTLFAVTDMPQVRRGALRGLARARGEASLPLLLETIADEDADLKLRAVAVDLAAALPGTMTTAALMQLLSGISAPVQANLIDALGERGDRAALPAVMALARSDAEVVRLAALRALAHIGDQDSALLLTEVAARTEGDERDTARRSLARLRAPGVDEALLAGLRDAAVPLRIELIRSLQARLCRMATAVLFTEARHADESVRVAAAEALGELASERDAASLVHLFVHGEGEAFRAAAADAAFAACQKIRVADDRSEPIMEVWSRCDPAQQAALIGLLGRVGGRHGTEDNSRRA